MSWLRDKFRRNPVLFLVLGAVALWMIYRGLKEAAPVVFLRLDASYGRLGGPVGYALLGLGLGAAAGAIAAQQRFRLNRLILVGAIGLSLGLISLTLLGNVGPGYIADIEQQPTEAVASPPEAEDEPEPEEVPVEPAVETLPDTSSTEADGWQQVVARAAPLRAHWADSLQAAAAYLHEGDTVRLLRRAHYWVRVVSGSTAGWVRLADLGPIPDEPAEGKSAEDEPAGIAARVQKPAAAPVAAPPAPAAEAPAATVPSPTWPTGHRQYTGRVGELSATYSLDWHPNGAVSGSYYYDKHPRTTYRLVGSGKPNGELHLLEFTRGQQTARCVLQPRETGYAGTMRNTDGQDFEMTIDQD